MAGFLKPRSPVVSRWRSWISMSGAGRLNKGFELASYDSPGPGLQTEPTKTSSPPFASSPSAKA